MANFMFLVSFNTQCHISLFHLPYLSHRSLENMAHSNEIGYRVMNANFIVNYEIEEGKDTNRYL